MRAVLRPVARSLPALRDAEQFADVAKWSPEVAEDALRVIASRLLEWVEYVFGAGAALLVVSGCLRGLFVAGPGRELVSSDYSAIEAVVPGDARRRKSGARRFSARTARFTRPRRR